MRRDWGYLLSGAVGAALTICSGPAHAFFPPVPMDPPVTGVEVPPPPPPPIIVPPVVPPVSPPPVIVPPVSPPPVVVCPGPEKPQVVPEPTTVLSAGLGLAVLAGWSRRRKA